MFRIFINQYGIGENKAYFRRRLENRTHLGDFIRKPYIILVTQKNYICCQRTDCALKIPYYSLADIIPKYNYGQLSLGFKFL